MNRIRNIYGKGSNSQDVNSGNIHSSVMDPQFSSDSACGHRGLPVLQMMSVRTSWNFGSVGIAVTKGPEVKVQGEGSPPGWWKADFVTRKRWLWVSVPSEQGVESSARQITRMPWSVWETPSVLSHIRLLSGYSWNWKPCSSRKTCWGRYKTSQFVILWVDKPLKLPSSWDSGGLGLKWSHSTISPKQVSMFYYQLLALI